MIHLSTPQAQRLAHYLPAATLTFLEATGVPEKLSLRGPECVFTLDMEPLAGGAAFRLGMVERDWYAAVVQRATGHFGLLILGSEPAPLGCVPIQPGGPPWQFINSSIADFFRCWAAADQLWDLVAAGTVAGPERGHWLAEQIRRIDPGALDNPEGYWAFFVEELVEEVV